MNIAATKEKNVPSLRFPEFSGEWEEERLGDVCSFLKDGTHGTHPDNSNGDYYLLSAKNLQNGKIVVTNNDRRIDQSEFDKITKNYVLNTDDVLLSIVGT